MLELAVLHWYTAVPSLDASMRLGTLKILSCWGGPVQPISGDSVQPACLATDASALLVHMWTIPSSDKEGVQEINFGGELGDRVPPYQ